RDRRNHRQSRIRGRRRCRNCGARSRCRRRNETGGWTPWSAAGPLASLSVRRRPLDPMRRNPIELELFRSLFVSIAEEMGAVLRKTSYSANIKERRDYSCAIYDSAGETVAMGDHMPVHLGAMPLSVRAALDAFTLRS